MMARRMAALVAAGTLLSGVALVGSAEAAQAAATEYVTPTSTAYPGDPSAEAAVAASEDRRITDVRTIANAQDWREQAARPYQLSMASGYTLVLVARDQPYTLKNLQELAPRYFSKQSDGSWLLSENIVVDNGATLDLSSDQKLELHLKSTPAQFVSIVTLGGSLTLKGAAEKSTVVTSWNPDTGKVDSDTTDGRSYIRVVGGRAEFADVTFTNLGFWSGMTGGVSLTGTGSTSDVTAISAAGATDSSAASATDGQAAPADTIHGTTIESTDGLTKTDASSLSTDFGYVSASVQNVTFSNDAFGLFVTSADGVSVRDSTATNNLVDGIVFHRNVTNSEILRTSSTANRVDGFDLDRASSGVTLSRLQARHNGRNGVTMNGSALADGPSATGLATESYGNNTISETTAADNARYGIEVIGGSNITVNGNTMTGNTVGLVVTGGAESVSVTANDIEDNVKQGIAFREAGAKNVIARNTVADGEIGIYLRASEATINRNTIDSVTAHAVTLVGDTGDSVIEKNTVAGRGPSAVDTARSTTDTTVLANQDSEWRSTKPLLTVLKNFFQPLTVMWLLLGLVLLVTAISGLGRKHRRIRDPFENLAPLATFTTGEKQRHELSAPVAVAGHGSSA